MDRLRKTIFSNVFFFFLFLGAHPSRTAKWSTTKPPALMVGLQFCLKFFFLFAYRIFLAVSLLHF